MSTESHWFVWMSLRDSNRAFRRWPKSQRRSPLSGSTGGTGKTGKVKVSHATEKFNYLYSEDELKEWVPRIRAMAENTRELHVIFKNKHADFPVKNAVRMKELLGLT